MNDEMKGEVKKWFEEKGFGFISCDGKDYFAHVTKLLGGYASLDIGDKVKFKIVDSPKGKQAIDIEKE